MFATIIPETKTTKDVEEFTYKIPENLVDQIKIGSIVFIPFGKQNIRGVVSMILETDDNKYKLRNITSIDENAFIPSEYLEIIRWISSYYLCSLGEALSMFLPPLMKKPREDSRKLKVESRKVEPIKLNETQEQIFQRLKINLRNPQKPALIHGVTGSGKTEIYIKLAEECLKTDKRVIVLVPEIMLTPQTTERFEEIFTDKVTLMHSTLSKSEKFRCYQDFISGQKPIIVGPRSALLVPSDKIGLIIIDEEQEDSFKQEQNPRYHAVDLAREIALKNNALLILGSATPRIETYYKALNNEYDLFILEKRFGKEQLPESEIVDLKDEMKNDNYSPISLKLQAEMHQVLADKKQILLFLNRRGSATFISCRDCGHVILCKNCSIPMVYYTNDKNSHLLCHHCASDEKVITKCPNCGSPKIKYFGAGVDKITEELRKLFPIARIAKVDSTTVTSRKDYENLYNQLKKHEIDIVIGTQMIAKGLDLPNIDLVGVISADTGLHLPHYKASEKTFQIITQVSGRSGRRLGQGKTIIQSYWPKSGAIIAASNHDYRQFYDQEITERKNFSYPPFIHLVRIVAENKDENKAKELIGRVKADLDKLLMTFIGPGPCFYKRLHDRYRFHIILKIENLPDARLQKLRIDYQDLVFDVDPTNLL